MVPRAGIRPGHHHDPDIAKDGTGGRTRLIEATQGETWSSSAWG
jgi:hypothetical protein